MKFLKFSNAFSLFSQNIAEDSLYRIALYSVITFQISERQSIQFASSFAAYLHKLLKLVLPLQLLQ